VTGGGTGVLFAWSRPIFNAVRIGRRLVLGGNNVGVVVAVFGHGRVATFLSDRI